MEKWDGVERRKEEREQKFCSAHIGWVADMAVIKSTLTEIKDTIKSGVSFKTGMIISMMGIVLTIVIQIIIFSYLYGGLCKQVEVNTNKWTMHESERNEITKQLEQMRIELRNPNIYKK